MSLNLLQVTKYCVSIVYEAQLKELVKLLQQPEVNCKACQASPPFEFHLTSRGTASIIQWVIKT